MAARVKIAIVITARPSYAKAKTVIAALLAKGADVQVIACASALLERYGRVVDVIRKDFPEVSVDELYSTLEGASLVTGVKETAVLLGSLADRLSLWKDRVCVIADRHEVLAVAQAAAYLHLPVVHLQGGERTGSIDDRCRDAITQLASIHLVSTHRAALRVYGLTGTFDSIHVTGCPSIDVAHQAQADAPVTAAELGGAGTPIDLSKPFLVVLQHPVTDEMADAGAHMRVTLDAVKEHGMPAVVFWPGEDAGQELAAKAIRTQPGIHTVRNLPPQRFLRLLTQAACLVGNSSAGIRECSYLGVPVVNIGTRQQGRERAKNVRDVPSGDPLRIIRAIHDQVIHGPYPSSALYGTGDAGERIAEVLTR